MLFNVCGRGCSARLKASSACLVASLFILAALGGSLPCVSCARPEPGLPPVTRSIGSMSQGVDGDVERKLLAVAPFALFVGILNPLLDRGVLFQMGGFGITGGWVSFASSWVFSSGPVFDASSVSGLESSTPANSSCPCCGCWSSSLLPALSHGRSLLGGRELFRDVCLKRSRASFKS